ncbi:uncharacterized protein BDZ99DRAFT_459179 [Mytilinidion resinicola]|uniref:Uncharacterized protein n=1 Tax=Mytilinidion resinicola TaxID=574789 RepID=A0A6A6Z4P5_9PEZI|nr:uncharacterized protein BDZ99DRAFT_459179 [Mytilinidion resinicola]KAF2815264.1 hypothetical protein BDZ99DRAFT_459179 [Mytilinidion resinicola]
MAGFFPFVFESVLKDPNLRASNCHFSWYRLFMDRTRELLSADGSSDALLRALDVIHTFRRRRMKKNVGETLQERRIEKLKLRRGLTLRDGWLVPEGVERVLEMSKDEIGAMVNQILKELGKI